MSTSRQRDKACILAKQDSEKAAKLAQDIHDPWYRAQALCWVVRFIVGDPSKIASKVIKAASECDDHYKKACARAWLVAAFAERGELHHARKILSEAVELARCVEPAASKAEALVLLLQAAMSIGVQDAESVHDLLLDVCKDNDHWRCKRACKTAGQLLMQEIKPRLFFW